MEESNFWYHLQLDGFLSNMPPLTITSQSGPMTVIAPTASFSNSQAPWAGWISSAFVLPFYSKDMPHNYYYAVCNYQATSMNRIFDQEDAKVMSYKPADALAIDAKIDDGAPGWSNTHYPSYTGSVIAIGYPPGDGPLTGNPGPDDIFRSLNQTCVNTNNYTYNTGQTNSACCLMIEMKGAE